MILFRDIKLILTQNLNANVSTSSFIIDKWARIQVFFSKQMVTTCSRNPNYGVLLHNTNEGITHTHKNLGESPENFSDGNKCQSQKVTYYIIQFM